MFRQLLIATALVAALGYCASALAIDKMGVPVDSYNSASSAPAGRAEGSPAAATGNDADSADVAPHSSISAPTINEEPVEPAANAANTASTTDDAPIEPLHALHPHTHAVSHANAPPAAPKNHANVRWQSLLPGVMK